MMPIALAFVVFAQRCVELFCSVLECDSQFFEVARGCALLRTGRLSFGHVPSFRV
jgi:hypothetical protein